MSSDRYPEEILSDDEDNGTMPNNVAELESHVVGHRIVSAARRVVAKRYGSESVLALTLDNGKQVQLFNTDDCCAFTSLEAFLLSPGAVDHVIMGVGTTDEYETWHIYADWGDILKLEVGWSAGNQFYYGYGFDINVVDAAGAL